ncbi:MAG: septum formation initiator family protein [Oscillospiraceae bacterium]|nr:septum formation initiator family protein [Oscillospiraceae bacterium]
MSLRLSSNAARRNVKRHSLVNIIAGAAVLIAAVFVVYTIVVNSIAVKEQTEKYDALVKQTTEIKEQNAQIEGYLNGVNLDEYIENIARDKFDYANPDERIYFVVPGK